MFKLGIITDEVSQDFEAALQFAKGHGLDCVELRSAWEKGPFEFTPSDIEKIRSLSEQYSLPVIAISSPFYKCSYFDAEVVEEHVKSFERLVGYAQTLGAKYIRCFDFLRDERVTHSNVKKAYDIPISLCEKAGLQILIESEPTANSYNCETLAALVEYIGHPAVRSLYDPGNNIYATEEIPYPDGYRFIRGTLAHIHIKDAVRTGGKASGCVVGTGEVDYGGLFRELYRSGYSGAVMLETHYKPKCDIPEEVLHNPKGSAISYMGDVASAECLSGLKQIMEDAERTA